MLSQSVTPDNARNASLQQSLVYTFEELQTIYEIISLATLSPSEYAFRNIWRAYETVLRHRNLDPALDSKFFRVLITLGGGGNLYSKFREFLQNNGFDVSTVNVLQPASKDLVSLYQQTRYIEARERKERASVAQPADDAFEAGGEAATSYSEISSKRKRYDEAQRKRNKDTVQSQPLARRGSTGGFAASLLPSESDDTFSELAGEKVVSKAEHDDAEHYRDNLPQGTLSPTKAEGLTAEEVLDNEIKSYLSLRKQRIMRKYFRHWQHLTYRNINHRNRMSHLAESRYRHWTLGRLFKDWLFVIKEIRTGNARDIFISGVMFARWAHQTAAIINRSNEMRRRIVARKYFNAWRQVVLEKEEKARQFFVSGSLYRWRVELSRVREMVVLARQFYEVNLQQSVLSGWWYRATGSLASERYNTSIMRQKLAAWRDRIQHSRILSRHADKLCNSRLSQKTFDYWLRRTVCSIDMQEDALDHREWSLVQRTLRSWRLQSKLNPRIYHVETLIDQRLLEDTFKMWRIRTYQSEAAKSLLREYLLRNAFKTWNLHLRYSIIATQVEDRIITDALYNWVLQTRLHIFRGKVQQWFLARSYLVQWRENCHEAVRKRRIENARAKALLKHNIYGGTLQLWRAQLQAVQDLEAEAEIHYNRNLARRVFAGWSNSNSKLGRLSSWAEDAQYFFLGTAAIGRWREALRIARRNRMKAVFTSFVQKRKRRLVGGALQSWHSRFQGIEAMEQGAVEFEYSIAQSMAVKKLYLWQGKLYQIGSLKLQLEQYRPLPLLRYFFHIWQNHGGSLRALGDRANDVWNYKEYQIKLSCLRTWNLANFKRKTRENTALLIRERNQKKLMQAFFVLWLDRLEAARLRAARPSLEFKFGADNDSPARPRPNGSSHLINLDTSMLQPQIESEDDNDRSDEYGQYDLEGVTKAEEAQGEDILYPFSFGVNSSALMTPGKAPSARATRARELMLRLTPGKSTTPAGSPFKRLTDRTPLSKSFFGLKHLPSQEPPWP